MHFEVYEMTNLLMKVTWNEQDIPMGYASVKNYQGKKDILLMPISLDEVDYIVDFKDVEKFLETRCVPRTRVDIDKLLRKKYHLREYNPLAICQQTHGVAINDYIWLKFSTDDDTITFESTKVR